MTARSFATLVALACLTLESRAGAEDWLAAYPECNAAARTSAPSFELLYPRPGLPALVEAGDLLIARVRLPAPLTPPPGVQQMRALVGWRAELIGRAVALSGPLTSESRQPLEVIGVRPDGARSLLYRASVSIPAWTAPGTYDLFLAAPGGEGVVHGALRVLERGHAARLAWSWQAPASFERSALPVDAWLLGPSDAPLREPAAAVAGVRDDVPELLPAPSVDLRASIAALRVGRELWLLGACDDEAYAAELRGLATREGRTLSRPIGSASGAGFELLGGGEHYAWPVPGSLRFARDARGLTLEVHAESPLDAELPLLLPGGTLAAPVEAGALAVFPAAEIAGERAPASIAILRVPRDARTKIAFARVVTPARARLEAPARVASGRPVRLRVLGAARGSRVAWRFSPLETAFGPPSIERAFIPLGEHRVTALVLGPDGASQRLEARVRSVTQQASSCAACRARTCVASPRALGFGLVMLYGGSRLLRRRKENDAIESGLE